jgi:SAM-dependent methyltransferase
MTYQERIQALLGDEPSRILDLHGRGDLLRLAAVPGGTMDAVVSVLALASADDVAGVLDEVVRVLRPGGRLVFVELVAPPPGSRRRRMQGLLAPLWRRTAEVSRPPRDLWNDLRAARFGKLCFERFDEPGLFGLAVPHIAGVATKARARELEDEMPFAFGASSPRVFSAPPRGFFG